MSIKSVKELLIPLSDYAVVPEQATVAEAIKALKQAQTRLHPARHEARAVLVVNDNKQVVGQIEQIDFLKALEPKYSMLGDLEPLSRAGLSDEMISALIDNMKFWQVDIPEACSRAGKMSVKEIMDPIKRSIDIETPLAEVIHKLVMWQARRVLVNSGKEIVGIIRLTDVFNNVMDYMEGEG
jgi:CBS-domain-containing membrane protein